MMLSVVIQVAHVHCCFCGAHISIPIDEFSDLHGTQRLFQQAHRAPHLHAVDVLKDGQVYTMAVGGVGDAHHS